MDTVVAFLRGINLGARHRVPMAELRALAGALGYANPRTHLQSGNLLVDTRDSAERVADTLEPALEERFGFAVPVIARTALDLAAVLDADPHGDVADDPKRYFVLFCSRKPRVPDLGDPGDERFAAHGRELFVWCPDGLRESRLMRALDKADLGATTTTRNWNTVAAVAELAGA